MRGERLCIYVRNVSFPAQETGRCFHVNGITVNKTTQTVESAAAGGAFHIEDVYPRIDGGRFPVKRVVRERIEVWADIYRDGHDVVNAALVWRREQDREWRREPMIHHSNDRWGGSLENRSRFLLQTIAAVRAAVGPEIAVSIKLNASDFQKGGFTNAECLRLIEWLNASSLDLLELSGGSLEQPKQVGASLKDEGEDARPQSTIQREAYFVDFAGAARATAKMPVMVTGGFRSADGMTAALAAGELDVVGIGRPMIADPETPKRLLSGEIERAVTPEDHVGLFHLLGWNNTQLERLGDGLAPDLGLGGEEAAAMFRQREAGVLADLLAARARQAA